MIRLAPRPAAWGLWLALLFLPIAAFAEVRVEVSPKRAHLDQIVQVTITVDGSEAKNARLDGSAPRGKNLSPTGGTSSQFEMSFINGRSSSTRTFIINYLPTRVGPAEVPSFTLVLTSGTVTTKAVPIEIVEAEDEGGSGGRARDPSSRRSESSDNVRISTRLDRNDVFVGESIELEYVLRTRVQVRGYDPTSLDLIPGFVIEDATFNPSATRREVRDADGVLWTEFTLFRRLLTPTRTGEIEIPPIGFRISVEQRTRDRDPFGFSFGFRNYVDVPVVARGVSVQVRPVPTAGRPDGFSGAVGNFELDASLDRTKTWAGEAVNLTVTVRGSRSIATAAPPQIDVPADVQLYDPVEQRSEPGSRTWLFPLVPRTAGRIDFGGARFSYFDPAQKAFAEAVSGPMVIEVAPARGETFSATTTPSPHAVPVEQRASDLRFVHPAPKRLYDRMRSPADSRLFRAAVVLPFVLFPLVFAAAVLHSRYSLSSRGRSARIRRVVGEHLDSAARSVKTRPDEAARETLEALYTRASALIGEPARPLERAKLKQKLAAACSDEALARKIVDWIDGAEAARYGGASDLVTVIEEMKQMERSLT